MIEIVNIKRVNAGNVVRHASKAKNLFTHFILNITLNFTLLFNILFYSNGQIIFIIFFY